MNVNIEDFINNGKALIVSTKNVNGVTTCESSLLFMYQEKEENIIDDGCGIYLHFYDLDIEKDIIVESIQDAAYNIDTLNKYFERWIVSINKRIDVEYEIYNNDNLSNYLVESVISEIFDEHVMEIDITRVKSNKLKRLFIERSL